MSAYTSVEITREEAYIAIVKSFNVLSNEELSRIVNIIFSDAKMEDYTVCS